MAGRDRTYAVRYAVLGVVGSKEGAEKDNDGGSVDEPGFDQNADNARELPASSAHHGHVLGSHLAVDSHDVIHDQT